MNGPRRTAELSVATFLFGFVAFSPPFLSIFGVEVLVFGLPLLYLYLFAVWASIIALVAWIADFGSRAPPDRRGARRANRKQAR